METFESNGLLKYEEKKGHTSRSLPVPGFAPDTSEKKTTFNLVKVEVVH